jgi:hypothetical protein
LWSTGRPGNRGPSHRSLSFGRLQNEPAKIAETSLFGVYKSPDVEAKGLVADGVSAAIAVAFDIATVAACFRLQGMPLAQDPDHPGDGAVFSLYPPDTKAKDYPPGTKPTDNAIKKLPPDANIPGADWRAVSAIAPDNATWNIC